MQRVVLGVLLGGVIGATCRWAVGELDWSTSTWLLTVNTVGCLVLGAVVARWADRSHPLRLALGVGFCGGLTTFSGLAVELAERLDADDVASALGLAAASVALGLVAFTGGRRVAS